MLPYVWDLLMIAVVVGISVGLAGPLTWVERRQSAMVQDRIGPNRAGFRVFGTEVRAFGLFHPIADAIKMLTKEDTINRRADRFLYNLAPFIALLPPLVTFAVIPFGPDVMIDGREYHLQVARIPAGMLYIFAVSSLAVFGVTLAGYASASKFAMLGGLRASAQMISYEVCMGLSIMGLFMIYGTLEPSAMVEAQGGLLFGWLPKWGIFLQPISFVIFLAAATAENKRVPFDTAEGESEIVGYFVEYSGMKFGMFYMAEYIEVIVIAGILSTLFFGGWQFPYLMDSGFVFPWGATFPMHEVAVIVLRVLTFFGKLFFFCWFQLMIRWTLPRFRYDQVMALGWRKLLPLSLINIIITAAVVLALQ
jgi:NADH-quinone oxidoreductase subunit H